MLNHNESQTCPPSHASLQHRNFTMTLSCCFLEHSGKLTQNRKFGWLYNQYAASFVCKLYATLCNCCDFPHNIHNFETNLTGLCSELSGALLAQSCHAKQSHSRHGQPGWSTPSLRCHPQQLRSVFPGIRMITGSFYQCQMIYTNHIKPHDTSERNAERSKIKAELDQMVIIQQALQFFDVSTREGAARAIDLLQVLSERMWDRKMMSEAVNMYHSHILKCLQ